MKPQYYSFLFCLLLSFSCVQEDSFIDEVADLKLPDPSNSKVQLKSVYPDGFEMEHHARSSMTLDRINSHLTRAGSEIRLFKMEGLASKEGNGKGTTIIFNTRGNRKQSAHWSPNDERGTGSIIPYTIDMVDLPSTLSPAEYRFSIQKAAETWQHTDCSSVEISETRENRDLGVIQSMLGFGGSTLAYPGIVHAGFLPAEFFTRLGSGNLLGVTFTFTSMDDPEQVLSKEIYYNNKFSWSTDGNSERYDFETVALHEVGHGLSQTHFGKLHRTDANGKFHFSPRAVMNAGYTGVQRSIRKTDNAGHCALWGNWPQN